jgi:hypothetical protein
MEVTSSLAIWLVNSLWESQFAAGKQVAFIKETNKQTNKQISKQANKRTSNQGARMNTQASTHTNKQANTLGPC